MTDTSLHAQETDNERVILRRARSYYLSQLREFIIVLVVIWIIVLYQQWFCISLVLLVLTVVGIKNAINQLDDDSVQIELSAMGIAFKGHGMVAWGQIRDVWLEYHKAIAVIVLELEQGNRVQYQVSGLDMLPNDLAQLIKQLLAIASPLYPYYKEGFINRLLHRNTSKQR